MGWSGERVFKWDPKLRAFSSSVLLVAQMQHGNQMDCVFQEWFCELQMELLLSKM